MLELEGVPGVHTVGVGRFLALSSNTEAVASMADTVLASHWSSITNTVHSSLNKCPVFFWYEFHLTEQ